MSSILGMNPSQMAQQYTQIDRAGKDSILSAKTKLFTDQLNGIKKLQTTLGSFLTQIKGFRSGENSILANSSSATDESVLKVKTDGKAVAGTYDLFVEQLAQNHQLALSFDPAATLATDGQFSIAMGGSSFSVDLSGLPANATVRDLAAAINNHTGNPGVNATLVRSGTETFLMISSDESGAANQLNLNFTAGADAAGANITNAITNRQELKQAQDAIVRLGSDTAISLTSSSNSLTDIIEGVTIDLVKAQAAGDGPVRVTVGQDSAAIKANLQKFIDSYNSTINTISNEASLKNDAMARGVTSQLRAGFQVKSGDTTFYAMGIEFDKTGKLSINSERFEKALNNDPSKLEAMLTSNTGLFAKLEAAIEPYSKSYGGLLGEKQKTLQASLDLVNESKKRHDLAMDMRYQRYVAQFTQMQMTIAQLESSLGQF